MAYTADIVIAVKGATQITNLQQRIQSLSAGVNSLNATLRSGTVASIDNFNKLVSQSDRVMRSAAQGTRVQKEAIDTYVRSVIAAEKAEKSLQDAIGRRRKELGLGAGTPAAPSRGGGRLGGAISGSIIGGSFPLLFGQGAGAAAGGAIGGLAGGLLGPGGSFAGSLLGTLLGDIATKGKAIKELGTDIGFSAEQTKKLQEAFSLAGQDADKFTAAVQNVRGLGLSIEDQANAIRLVSQLTETYGGRIDKVTSAFVNALESGKVTQATINQLTNEGITVQDALAQKYGVSRDAILQMAKDGKISVQTLADVLVDMGNKGLEAGQKPKSAFDQFTEALGNTATAVGNVANVLLTVLGPAIDAIILKAAAALNALTETINTELLRTKIQGQTGKIISPERLKNIEQEAMGMAARRYPSKAQGRQLAAGTNIISPQAQQEFQILREQGIRNELQRFGYEQGILKVPTNITPPQIGRIAAPGQLPPSGGGGGGKSAADKAADAAAKEAARVAEVIRARQLATIELQRQAVFSAAIAAAELNKDQLLTRQLQGNQELVQLGIQVAAALEKETNSSAQLAIAREFQAKKALVLLGIELDIAKIKQEQKEQYDTIISDLDTELALKYAITEQERTQLRIAAEMKKLQQSSPFLTPDQLAIIQQGKERLATPKTGNELILERTGALEDELKVLTDYGTTANSIATGIGDAFANSFKGIVSGSMSAREALAGFFQSVADQFLDMAAQITAKWIQLTILNSILKLFPGAGGVGGGLGSVDANLAQYAPLPNAKGNAFGANGIIPFAKGGIVNGPTLFPFANGTGLMGEAGPEAIMPLQRGANGKLGVLASGGGGNVSVVVNVDASGSNVEGDAEDSKQLGRVIAAAIQQELVKQKRPGGLLA